MLTYLLACSLLLFSAKPLCLEPDFSSHTEEGAVLGHRLGTGAAAREIDPTLEPEALGPWGVGRHLEIGLPAATPTTHPQPCEIRTRSHAKYAPTAAPHMHPRGPKPARPPEVTGRSLQGCLGSEETAGGGGGGQGGTSLTLKRPPPSRPQVQARCELTLRGVQHRTCRGGALHPSGIHTSRGVSGEDLHLQKCKR